MLQVYQQTADQTKQAPVAPPIGRGNTIGHSDGDGNTASLSELVAPDDLQVHKINV